MSAVDTGAAGTMDLDAYELVTLIAMARSEGHHDLARHAMRRLVSLARRPDREPDIDLPAPSRPVAVFSGDRARPPENFPVPIQIKRQDRPGRQEQCKH